MNTPFGPAFADLTLDHLRAFFAEPRVESLTWEAKGEGLPSEPAREQLRPEQVREPVCAFANALPDIYGHLVLGVDPATPADERKSTKREASNWAVNGWAPRGDDPHEWMSNCVGSIDPRPHIEIKSFAVEGSRWVTVVQIAPSPIVPCITTEGLIFERLPGVTQTVRTSETLRALYARGETARSRAETLSRRTVLELSQTNLLDARPLAVVAIGAPALPADISSPLFRESTVNEVLKLLTRGARFRVGADSAERRWWHGWTVPGDAKWRGSDAMVG